MAVITPIKLQTAVEHGFKRMKHARKARAMFVKQAVGQYYREKFGITNDEPINLLFHAVSIFVANLVMRRPTVDISTDILPYQEYGNLLGMAVDRLNEEIKLKDTLRKWVVDAFFGLSILKTGIARSTNLFNMQNELCDAGQPYTSHVDLDNFVFDAVCTDLNESAFYGDRIPVPREVLLNDKYVNKDLVAKLPSISQINEGDNVKDITRKNQGVVNYNSLYDMINVVELWIPDAGIDVLIPDPSQYKCNDFIKVTDYYGPEEGRYTFLSVTAPVPGNPFPVAPVGLWYDLHIMANRIFKKIINQSDRQKDVLLYDPANADEAQDILESKDADAIGVTDPTKFNSLSLGGANKDNVAILSQFQLWFNYMAGNPDQMAGMSDAESATQADINQSNSMVKLSDMRDVLYDRTSEVIKKEAFYLHYDPLIELPMVRRLPGGESEQVILTPEQQEGNYLDYNYNIRAKSMAKLDETLVTRRMLDFAVKVLPGVVNAAMIAMQMGTEFNLQRALTDIAEKMDIANEVSDWFKDPEYMKKIERMMQMNPKPDEGKGIVQNGQSPFSAATKNPTQEKNASRQERAGEAQRFLGNKETKQWG